MTALNLRNNIISAFLKWQFSDVPEEIFKGWKNFLYFNLNFFSIPTLLKTIFSHWHRYYYSYGKGFNPGRYFEAFIFNMMSRIIGAILRIFFIVIGLAVEIFLFFSGLVAFSGWIILPFILVAIFLYGFGLLF